MKKKEILAEEYEREWTSMSGDQFFTLQGIQLSWRKTAYEEVHYTFSVIPNL